MTIDQITKEVSSGKAVSRRQVVRYLRDLEIRPLGRLRQRPQIYPDDAGKRILAELGIVSMAQLRRERTRAQKARAA